MQKLMGVRRWGAGHKACQVKGCPENEAQDLDGAGENGVQDFRGAGVECMGEGVLGRRQRRGETPCRDLRAQHPPGYVQDVHRLQYATVTPSAPPELGSMVTPLRPVSAPSLALAF